MVFGGKKLTRKKTHANVQNVCSVRKGTQNVRYVPFLAKSYFKRTQTRLKKIKSVKVTSTNVEQTQRNAGKNGKIKPS